MARKGLLRGQSSGTNTAAKSKGNSKLESNFQQWYQSRRRNRMGRTSGIDRRFHDTQIRNLQGIRRNLELANLLRDWSNGGEINEKRIRKPRCYRCKDKGHFAWGCPKKGERLPEKQSIQDKVDPVSKSGDQSDRTFGPLQPYHQTHVERTIINGDYLVEGTNTESWNSIWYVNSKISKHMTPSKDIFVKVKKCFSINDEEYLLNPLLIHGVGEINLTTDVKIYVVPYVSYVPEININVLSMKQLILQGFEIEVRDSKCKITHMCDDRKNAGDVQNKSVKIDSKIIEENHPELEKTQEHEASTSTINDKLEINGKSVPLIIETLDDFPSCFWQIVIVLFIRTKDCSLGSSKKHLFCSTRSNKIKNGEEITLPPELAAGLKICLFDLYKLIVGSGGHEKISREGEWKEIAMSFGYPESYDQAFNKLFEDYLLHPQEYFDFAQKRFGKLPSIEDQEVGGLTNRIQDQSGNDDHGSGTSVGGVTRGNDQEDQNTATTQATDQTKTCKTQGVEDNDEDDPSIEGYYSDGDIGISSEEDDDFVIIV